MSKWITLSARIPEEKYMEYMKVMDKVSSMVDIRNSKGEVTVSSFVAFCIDRIQEVIEGRTKEHFKSNEQTHTIRIPNDKYESYMKVIEDIKPLCNEELTLSDFTIKCLDRVAEVAEQRKQIEDELKGMLG